MSEVFLSIFTLYYIHVISNSSALCALVVVAMLTMSCIMSRFAATSMYDALGFFYNKKFRWLPPLLS